MSRGESPMHPRAARQLLGARSGGPPSRGRPDPAGEGGARLVRRGLANKQIARRLGITERTVKAHLTSVFPRIGVATAPRLRSGPSGTSGRLSGLGRR